MSHRTADLTPLTGIAHVIRELRYHEVSRQTFAVVLILLYTLTAVPIPALAAIGLPIALIGAFVRLYASGFIVKNQELATDGAYRFVRHPLYTGNILLVVGFALAGSRWWGLPVALFFFWSDYPTAIEYEGASQATPPLRCSVGELVRADAGADAALRRRVARGCGRPELVVRRQHQAQRRARTHRVRVGLRRVGGLDRIRLRPARGACDRRLASRSVDGRARRCDCRGAGRRELGSGYQASVHVYTTSIGDVVVKTPHHGGPLGGLWRSLLRREQSIYARLGAIAGIPRSFGLVAGGQLALEYVAGPSLRDYEARIADREGVLRQAAYDARSNARRRRRARRSQAQGQHHRRPRRATLSDRLRHRRAAQPDEQVVESFPCSRRSCRWT